MTTPVPPARGSPRAPGASAVQPQPPAAGLVQVIRAESAGPVPLVVLGREVARAGTGGEGRPDLGRVALVARAPGRGRDVHHVAPALLVFDRRDAVDQVAVPPDRVARPHVRDPG